MLIITMLAIWGTMHGHGPFLEQTPAENALELQSVPADGGHAAGAARGRHRRRTALEGGVARQRGAHEPRGGERAAGAVGLGHGERQGVDDGRGTESSSAPSRATPSITPRWPDACIPTIAPRARPRSGTH
jgi:hypothetical protein